MASILAIGTATGYDLSTGAVVLTTDSLQTSGLDLGLTMEEVRGGKGNALQGYLPHTTSFKLKMDDSLFKFEYMALNCGGSITAGADVMTVANVTTSVANQITAPTTPVIMSGDTVARGWYRLQSDTTNTWTPITFTGSVATTTIASGTAICLKYMNTNSSARQFTVAGNFLPSVIRLEVIWSLYATSDTTSSQSLIGELQFEIPRFQFDGAQSYSVSASGTTTSPISGTALINKNPSCTNGSYYAKVKEVIYNKGVFDNVTKLLIAESDGDQTIAIAGTDTITVYGVFNDGTDTSTIANSNFTFTSSVPAKATVSSSGVVTGVATGTTIISVVAVGNPSLTANTQITVA